jgi:alanyl-tRNA synthetase
MTGIANGEVIEILDTQKENDLIIHFVDKLPTDNVQSYEVKVDAEKRALSANNHSATHLLHAALKQVLGNHVAQKGSLVNDEYLRFDFSHFSKLSEEEIEKIESIVNQKISENIALDEKRLVPIKQAVEEFGATALFGEKYGDLVRVITFDKAYSVELCGGTHVKSTGQIRRFKIRSESSVAAGVRRIEAITSVGADAYYKGIEQQLKDINELLGEPKDVRAAIQKMSMERSELLKKIEQFELAQAGEVKQNLQTKIQKGSKFNYIIEHVNGLNADAIKTICFQLRNEQEKLFGVLLSKTDDKPMITVFATDDLMDSINCSQIVRDLAKHIQGGGGGQPFFATAGGKLSTGLAEAEQAAKAMVS